MFGTQSAWFGRTKTPSPKRVSNMRINRSSPLTFTLCDGSEAGEWHVGWIALSLKTR